MSDTHIPLNDETREAERLPASVERRIPLVPLLALAQVASIFLIGLFVL